MPGLMAEEEHRPQGSDAATGDGKPDEAVLRPYPYITFTVESLIYDHLLQGLTILCNTQEKEIAGQARNEVDGETRRGCGRLRVTSVDILGRNRAENRGRRD